ncbi:LysM peptidoglycan-binding domain-containing M23 family metallopeptidase [Microcystis sp. BLCC-F210]|uniref:LysM peptidoglycan-binding domain-containing M23 family metallopeptidase n=1 Tax=Microcystis sp. BLCC-F210 TaxID=3342751 RepID=UPI0035C8DAD7
MVMGRRIKREKSWLSLISTILFFCLGFLSLNQKLIFAQGFDNVCPPPILSRLQRHKIQAGETIASIAEKYALIPATIIKLNPTILKNGLAPVGKEIFIPPMNGIRIEAPKGSTWRDLEAAYGIRADILFELNGCGRRPTIVFIPGSNWSATAKRSDYTGLSSYPLPLASTVGLAYGWQKSPTEQKNLFHSGVDLLADIGTPVLAAEDGLVIYVGQEGAYGNLVVINHLGRRQTRYAHLSRVTVRIDQRVRAGDVIGAVGTTGQPDIIPPHLHFEVRLDTPVGWTAQDPALHLPQIHPQSSQK